MGFIKSQAKRYTRGVTSSHFINHFKHEGVSATSELYKRETNSKASEMQILGLGEAGFITLNSNSQVMAVEGTFSQDKKTHWGSILRDQKDKPKKEKKRC